MLVGAGARRATNSASGLVLIFHLQAEDLDARLPAAHGGAADGRESEALTAREVGGAAGYQDAGSMLLVELLEARGEVDLVPVHGEAEPVAGADQAAHHPSGVYADPRAQLHALAPESVAPERALHVTGRLHRFPGMVLEGFRHVEGGEDRVALELVDDPAVAHDGLAYHGEVLVQHVDELLRRQPLAQRGEALDVGEQDGGLPDLSLSRPHRRIR